MGRRLTKFFFLGKEEKIERSRQYGHGDIHIHIRNNTAFRTKKSKDREDGQDLIGQAMAPQQLSNNIDMDEWANHAKHQGNTGIFVEIDKEKLLDGEQDQQNNNKEGDKEGFFLFCPQGQIVEHMDKLLPIGFSTQSRENLLFALTLVEQYFDIFFLIVVHFKMISFEN